MTKHKSSSSFTPFIDPRLLQISPSSGSSLNNMGEFLGMLYICYKHTKGPHNVVKYVSHEKVPRDVVVNALIVNRTTDVAHVMMLL